MRERFEQASSSRQQQTQEAVTSRSLLSAQDLCMLRSAGALK